MFLSDTMEKNTKVRCQSTERFTHIDLSDDENGLHLSMPHAVAETLHKELGNALAQLHGRQFAEGRVETQPAGA